MRLTIHHTITATCLAGYAKTLSVEDWSQFNASIDGRLQRVQPMELPCFHMHNGIANPVDEDACSRVRGSYTTASFRAGIPGVAMNAQDYACLSNPSDQCLLDNNISPAGAPAADSSCNDGQLASYLVPVRDASDVAAAFAFAREHNVSISIKNSGHDYMTRNFHRGSLMLWVHNLQNISYHDLFIPDGCDGTPGSASDARQQFRAAMTIATGVSSDTATAFATANNATLLVGSSPTVAISGGWILGAGHSVLSPVYGLGVDRVVQFTIVTPDGQVRIANACQNEDLFWALRGGGGGTFGVVLDATHRVEPTMPVAVANMSLPSNITADVAVGWLALQAHHGLGWARQGWGGHGGGTYLTHVNPLPGFANLSDADASAAVQSMSSATRFVLAHGGSSVVEVLPSWKAAWDKYIKPQAAATGGMRMLGNRLWPQRLFEDVQAQGKGKDKGLGLSSLAAEAQQGPAVVGFVRAIQKLGIDPRSSYIPADLPFLVPGSSEGYDTNTSTHPAWYSSLWNYGGGMTLGWNSSYDQRLQAIVNVTAAFNMAGELIGPGGGAYLHETSIFTKDWQNLFWGPNYQRLLEIKNKYDPDRVLRCWKCVGFEDAEIQSPMFQCQGKLQTELDGMTSSVDDNGSSPCSRNGLA